MSGTLSDLITRLEGVGGTDRELENLIWCAALGYEFIGHATMLEGVIFRHNGQEFRHEPLRLTASLDAAIGLVERVQPTWCWRVAKQVPSEIAVNNGRFWATCGPPGAQEDACADSPAMALCLALLRALQAKEGGEDPHHLLQDGEETP